MHGRQAFADELSNIPELSIDHVILNAGILKYPNVRSQTAGGW